MSPDKMVTMANQIATFFDSQPGDPAKAIAGHLCDYWDPDMRRQLADYVRDGGARLLPTVCEAIGRIEQARGA
ncbi:MAG: formate dehydrogenase subunit delta [Paracoccus sp. (in: a-proteobacteria)]